MKIDHIQLDRREPQLPIPLLRMAPNNPSPLDDSLTYPKNDRLCPILLCWRDDHVQTYPRWLHPRMRRVRGPGIRLCNWCQLLVCSMLTPIPRQLDILTLHSG